MPKVLNKNKDIIPKEAVYIGRPSKWGNPYRMLGEHKRDFVCDKFEAYLKTSNLDLSELRGKDLVCYCAPKRCHGDILLREANK